MIKTKETERERRSPHMGEESISELEVSQASPARPSGMSSVKIMTGKRYNCDSDSLEWGPGGFIVSLIASI